MNNIYIKDFVSNTSYLLHYQGLDYMIYYHFLLNNKKVYGLDNNDDKDKKESKTFFDKVDKMTFFLFIILRFQYGKKLFDMSLPNHILTDIYNHDSLYNNQYYNNHYYNINYILYKRNRIWLPKINDYIEKLDYPLFVVGHAHISDLLDLLNDTNLYNIKKL
jgi:hypothetical protein